MMKMAFATPRLLHSLKALSMIEVFREKWLIPLDFPFESSDFPLTIATSSKINETLRVYTNTWRTDTAVYE